MEHLHDFSSFAKKGTGIKPGISSKEAIAYTRVSSKEQADKNLSLVTQKKAIEEYAQRNGISILSFFGGTHESAKTDGRKEFQRMLEYVRKNKGKISYILVYTLDRFSRTGGAAIKLAQDLREKYGVAVFAVTQPTDTNNPSGVLHQNIQLLFSQFDNEQRKLKAVAGMREKFLKGEWVVRVPLGFDIVKINGIRKIVVNEKGRLLRKAFAWKIENYSNEAILQKLRARGLSVSKQTLSKIFANPFYCGLMAHGMLDGKVIAGNQEKLVSEEVFLKVNQIRVNSKGYGVPHKKENEQLPLKLFLKCGDCNEPFAGYIVKTKGLYYYKCRTIGCKCNRSAKLLNKQFGELLLRYQFKPTLAPLLEKQLFMLYQQANKSNVDQQTFFKQRVKEVKTNMDSLEEKFYIHEQMTREVFDRLYSKCKEQLLDIDQEMDKSGNVISNPETIIKKAVNVSSKLSMVWTSSPVGIKRKLQNLVFPEGIYYEREIGGFRTMKVNSVFEAIADLATILSENKKGQTDKNINLSLSAEREGL